MFEKEAEEYANQSCFTEMPNPSLSESIDISDDIKDAVMFGYNKKCEETFEMALSQIKHDRAVVIEENERLHAKNADLEKENTELKMQLEEWKKCFLSCSSPFCSKHFPTVESSGVLGNMEKTEND